MQALVRNQLADPFILGVSSGAAAAATLGMLFGVFSFWEPIRFLSARLSVRLLQGEKSVETVYGGMACNRHPPQLTMEGGKIELAERVKKGWQISAAGYSKIIQGEFKDGAQKFWAEAILGKAPYGGTLKILDVGTGPGFFAMFLSQAGHNVTGIDASAEMIACAEENCAKAGVSPELLVMDSHKLDFADETFDLIVSRNVVWTLTDPVKAYREWHRVLKSGGRMIVFDGNWSSNVDEQVKAQAEADRAEYIRKYGEPPISYKPDEEATARGWKRDMPLNNEKRPDWDEKTLRSIGCKNIGSKFILDEVFDEKRKLLHRANPMFMLWADK